MNDRDGFDMTIGITYIQSAYSEMIKYAGRAKHKSENLISFANKPDWGRDMENLDVVKLLKAAQNLERNISVSLMYSGLRVPQYRLLDVLAGMGQATVTEMSEKLSVRRATASVLINELIESGIVEVTENNSDRRSFHIRLTRMGAGKLEAARKDIAVFREKLSQKYSPEMIKMLNEFADRLT
jgi:DNA-binding MarR family transcriptional regulator